MRTRIFVFVDDINHPFTLYIVPSQYCATKLYKWQNVDFIMLIALRHIHSNRDKP